MRLVKNPTTKLSPDEGRRLADLVREAVKKDSEFFQRCDRFRSLLKGKQWDDTLKERKYARLTINLMHSHVRSLLPSLFFKDPYIEAAANHPDQESSAMVWEGLINHVLEVTSYKKETKEIVMDSIVYGEGWKKWVFQKEADDEEIETGEETMDDPTSSSGSLVEGASKGPSDMQNITAPVGYRISPTQVIPESKDRSLENSRFVAVRYQKLLSELIADSRYDKVDKEFAARFKTFTTEDSPGGGFVMPDTVDWQDDTQTHGQLVDKDQLVTIYEVWIYQLVDLNLYKQVVTLIEDFPEPIRGPTPWAEFSGKYLHKYPFNRIVLNPVPDDEPVSELHVIKSLQQAINWLTSRMTAMTENQKQIHTYFNSMMKDPAKARRQMASKNIMEFIELNDTAMDSNRPPIEPIIQKPISNDDYQLLNLIQSYFQQLTGFGQNRRGAAGIRTAREAMIIEQGTQIKLDEKVDIVTDFVKSDADILVRMLRFTTPPGFVFRLRGTAGPIKWGQFTQEDAAWSPDIRVRPSSFRVAVTEERAQFFQIAMNVGLQLFQVYGPRIRLDEMYRSFLEELGVPDSARFLSDVLDDERKQMIEMIQMANGVPVPVQETDNHPVEFRTIMEFVNSPLFEELSPEGQSLILDHMSEHQNFVEGQPDLQGGAQGSAPQGLPGPQPEQAGPSPEEGGAF